MCMLFCSFKKSLVVIMETLEQPCSSIPIQDMTIAYTLLSNLNQLTWTGSLYTDLSVYSNLMSMSLAELEKNRVVGNAIMYENFLFAARKWKNTPTFSVFIYCGVYIK